MLGGVSLLTLMLSFGCRGTWQANDMGRSFQAKGMTHGEAGKQEGEDRV